MLRKYMLLFALTITILSPVACSKQNAIQPNVSITIEVANFTISDLIELKGAIEEGLSYAKKVSGKNQNSLISQAEITIGAIQRNSTLRDVVREKTEEQRLVLDLLNGMLAIGLNYFQIPSSIAEVASKGAEELGNRIAEWQVLGQLSYAKFIQQDKVVMELFYYKNKGEIWVSFYASAPDGQLSMYLPVEPKLVSSIGTGNIVLSEGVKPILEKSRVAYYFREVSASTPKPSQSTTQALPGLSASQIARVGDYSISISKLERQKDYVQLEFVIAKVSEGIEGGLLKISLVDDHDNQYPAELNVNMSGAPDSILSLLPKGFNYVETLNVQMPEKAPIQEIVYGERASLSPKDVIFTDPSLDLTFGDAILTVGDSYTISQYLSASTNNPNSELTGWSVPITLRNSEYNPLPVEITMGIQYANGEIKWFFKDYKTEIAGSEKYTLGSHILSISESLYLHYPKNIFIQVKDTKTSKESFKVITLKADQFPPIPERIAYSYAYGFSTHLWIRTIDGSSTISDKSDFGEGSYPSWSKDGTKLAFVRGGILRIKYADDNFSEKTTVIGEGRLASFSPDGTRITYQKGAEVYIANIDGSGKKVLAEGNSPDWSPDGKYILYSYKPYSSLPNAYELFVISVDGSNKMKLGLGFNGAWSPDGQKIVYQQSNIRGFGVMNSDGSGVSVLPVDYGNLPRWSPDGLKIIWFSSTQSNVYTANSDGSGKETLFKGIFPVWAPAYKLDQK